MSLLLSYKSTGTSLTRRGIAKGGSSLPSVPTSVTTSNATGTTIDLNWAVPTSDGGSAITGYQKSRTGGVTSTLSATTFSFTFTGLTPGTVYVLSVAAVNANGVGPAVSKTITALSTTASRFPGDPNPKASGKWYWGIDEYDTDPKVVSGAAFGAKGFEYVAPEAMAKNPHNALVDPDKDFPCGLQRQYYLSWAPIVTPTGNGITWIKDQLANGRLPWVSIFVASSNATGQTWAQAADGRNASRWLAFITWVEEHALGPVWFTLCHEPRDNAGDVHCGSPAEFADMNKAFRASMDDYADANGVGATRSDRVAAYKWKNFAFGPILTDTTYQVTDSKSVVPFMTGTDGLRIPHRTYDFMGVDSYIGLGLAVEPKTWWMTPWVKSVAWIEANNYPLAIGEFGIVTTYPDAGTKLAGFYNQCMDGTHDIIGIGYYHTDLGGHTWLLRDLNNAQFATTFVNLMRDDRSGHYWDFGYTKPSGVV